MESPFQVLGVPPGADEDEIQQAYRQRVKEVHPDQGGSAEAFQRVKAAYEELTEGNGRWEQYADRVASGPTATSPATTGTGTVDDAEADDEPEEQEEGYEVEYLNYEVLDDHGWDLEDEDLFEKAAGSGLDGDDYGFFWARAGDTLLEAAEDSDFTWPYSCRGGACANCAVAVVEGDLSMPVSHILSEDLTDRGIRLSCVGEPITDDLKVVFNVKHLPDVEDLLLPPGPFEWNRAD